MSKVKPTIVYTYLLLVLLAIIGEIMCIYKFVSSDFKPAYTREIVYGLGVVTGTGAIIGWLDISDGKE